MASIKISELYPIGCELFFDSESYMRELSEGELDIQGGLPMVVIAIAVGAALLLAHD